MMKTDSSKKRKNRYETAWDKYGSDVVHWIKERNLHTVWGKQEPLKLFREFAFRFDPTFDNQASQFRYLDWLCRSAIRGDLSSQTIKGVRYLYTNPVLIKRWCKNLNTLTASEFDELCVQQWYKKYIAGQSLDSLYRKIVEERIKHDETIYLYEGKSGQIIIPCTRASAIYWGSDEWCVSKTGASVNNSFAEYNVSNPILFYLPSRTNKKWSADHWNECIINDQHKTLHRIVESSLKNLITEACAENAVLNYLLISAGMIRRQHGLMITPKDDYLVEVYNEECITFDEQVQLNGMDDDDEKEYIVKACQNNKIKENIINNLGVGGFEVILRCIPPQYQTVSLFKAVFKHLISLIDQNYSKEKDICEGCDSDFEDYSYIRMVHKMLMRSRKNLLGYFSPRGEEYKDICYMALNIDDRYGYYAIGAIDFSQFTKNEMCNIEKNVFIRYIQNDYCFTTNQESIEYNFFYKLPSFWGFKGEFPSTIETFVKLFQQRFNQKYKANENFVHLLNDNIPREMKQLQLI